MFKVDFDICQINCDRILFTDNTGQYISGVSECCKSGYGYPGNPTQDQVTGVEVTFTFPDGSIYNLTSLEFAYLPPVNACASFDLSGTQGSVVLVADGAVIGQAIYVSSLTQTIQDLVNSVNLGTEIHNYYAYFNGSTITVCDTCGGSTANGKTIEVCVFMLGTSSPLLTLAGGANEGWCLEMGTGDIDLTEVNNCFKDGIYTVTMNVSVDDGAEIIVYSSTKKFIFDCLSNVCLKELILLSTSKECPCSDKKIHDEIQKLRTDIEAANILYNECEYTCANELLQDTQNFCKNVCLDCN